MAEEYAVITTNGSGSPNGASLEDYADLSVPQSLEVTMLRQAKDCVNGLRASLREVAARQEREQELLLAKFLTELSESVDEPPGTAQSGPSTLSDSNGKCQGSKSPQAFARSMIPSFSTKKDTGIDVDASPSTRLRPEVAAPSTMKTVKEHESSPAIRKLLSAMKDAEARAKQEEEKAAQRSLLQRLVGKPWFDAAVGTVIVANIAVMAVELEYDGRMMKDEVFGYSAEPSSVPWIALSFEVLEQLFTIFFAAELALRLGADGLSYLRSFSKAADAVIVVVCSLDSWVFTPSGVEGMSSIVLLRLLRLLRLAKVFRVVRVMRVFHSLRVLVCAIMTSVGALLWSMTLLFVIELSSGLLMARLFHASMLDGNVPEETREWLWTSFGTCCRSFLTMFEITMAPGAFIAHRRIFDDVSPVFTMLFIVYVCFVTFAVIRVITAMFLKATLSAHSSEDAEQTHQRELLACMELLNGANANANGTQRDYWLAENGEEKTDIVCREDLAELLTQPKMVTWLEDLELSADQAMWLFDVIDGGDGRVHFNKYVAALLHMKGTAKAADMTIQFHEIRHMVHRLEKIEMLLGHVVRPAGMVKPDVAPQELASL